MIMVDTDPCLDRDRYAVRCGRADSSFQDHPQPVALVRERGAATLARDLGDRTAEVQVDMIDALGAAARRIPVLLDGFVSSVAGLVAIGFRKATAASLVAATRSPEPGHALVLENLGLEPLLDLGVRLGEGSGAALALPLVRSAIAILTDMATLDAAGVSGPASAVEPKKAAGDA